MQDTKEQEYKFFKNEYFEKINTNYFRPILDDVFKLYGHTIQTMADVGCGNGIFSGYLKKEHSLRLYGFDASRYALEQARKEGFDEVIYTPDLSSVPLAAEDHTFDFILNKDVLEHLLDPEFLVKEMTRALKPGGLLLVHVPNDFNLWKRVEFVFKNSVDTYGYTPDAKEWNLPHIRFFTFKGIQELFFSQGYEMLKHYSSFFGYLPVVARLPGCKNFGRWLGHKNPTQFSCGITILFRKRA